MKSGTLVIVGAGPGLGLAIAQEFGKMGFRVALIARRRASLDEMVANLAESAIDAKGYIGDVSEEQSLLTAFAQIKADFGSIDLLEWSPLTRISIPVSQVTTDIARVAFQSYFLGAVASVQQILGCMIEKGSGAILITGGKAALSPMWQLGSVSPMAAALRSYAYMLHDELDAKGVYVGTVTVCCKITPEIAQKVAGLYGDMYKKRDRVEEIVEAG